MNNKETIEEAADKLFPNAEQIGNETYTAYKGFIEGAKWQAERMYSEEDLLGAFEAGMMFIGEDKGSFIEWLEQFKKK